MRKPKRSKRFRQDVDRLIKRRYDFGEFKTVISLLINETPLPAKYRDHALKGKLSGYRDCHIESDWVLIYAIRGNVLFLYRTGSHADILE